MYDSYKCHHTDLFTHYGGDRYCNECGLPDWLFETNDTPNKLILDNSEYL
jgi:hypothetical protein